MKIIRMRLENFQGIKDYEITPGGASCSVYGGNGAGKTTLYNAYCWLMYGRPSTEEKNYTPQTSGTHGLNHAVEMEIETDSGTRTVLKKDFHEVYKRARGSAKPYYSGRASDYYINGAPVKEKDFQKKMLDLYEDGEIAKMLTRYDYFLEAMPMEERRSYLIGMCGIPEQESVIAVDPRLEALPAIIGKHAPEEYEKIAKARKKEVGKELMSYDPRIMEAQRAKPDVSNLNEGTLRSIVEENERDKADYEKRLAALQITASADIRKKISEAQAEKAAAEAAHIKRHNEANRAAAERVEDLTGERIEAETKAAMTESAIRRLSDEAGRMAAERERLLEAYRKAAAKEYGGDGLCPACGQPLPPEMAADAAKRWNAAKSETLEKIRKDGEAVSREKIDKLLADAARLKEEKEGMEKELARIREELAEAKGRMRPAPPWQETEECRKHDEKIAALKKRLADAEAEAGEEAERLADLVRRTKVLIQTAREDLAKIDLARKQDERIAELEEGRKKAAGEYEDAEYALHLCGVYKQKQAELMESRINGMFESIQFRLFRELQKSGADGEREAVPDCEALIPCGGAMVPFKSANNAARINAGLEMTDALSRHYGMTLPVFIDNAESCTEIRETEAQQIRLYVSSADGGLRAEYGRQDG